MQPVNVTINLDDLKILTEVEKKYLYLLFTTNPQANYFPANNQYIVHDEYGNRIAIKLSKDIITNDNKTEYSVVSKFLGKGVWGSVSLLTKQLMTFDHKDKKVNISEYEHKRVVKTMSSADADKRYAVRMELEAASGLKLEGFQLLQTLQTPQGQIPYTCAYFMKGKHSQGKLPDLLKKSPGLDTPQGHSEIIVRQLFDLYERFHSKGYSHNDIKPNNCIYDIDSNGRAKAFWIDIGFSAPSGTQCLGTPRYYSPEVAAGYKSTCESDIFSLAVCILVQCGFPHTDRFTRMDQITSWSVRDGMLQQGIKEAVASGKINPDMAKMLKQMLSFNPSDRPTARDLAIGFAKQANIPLKRLKIQQIENLVQSCRLSHQDLINIIAQLEQTGLFDNNEIQQLKFQINISEHPKMRSLQNLQAELNGRIMKARQYLQLQKIMQRCLQKEELLLLSKQELLSLQQQLQSIDLPDLQLKRNQLNKVITDRITFLQQNELRQIEQQLTSRELPQLSIEQSLQTKPQSRPQPQPQLLPSVAVVTTEASATGNARQLQPLSDVDKKAKQNIKKELDSYIEHVKGSFSQQDKAEVIRNLEEIKDKLKSVEDKNDWKEFKDYFNDRKEKCFGHHDPVALSYLKTIMMWLSSILVVPVIGYIASGNAGMYVHKPHGRSVSKKIETEIEGTSSDNGPSNS